VGGVGRGLVQVRVWVLGEVVGVGGAGYGCRRVQVRVWRWMGGWMGGWVMLIVLGASSGCYG